jgi:hypothetical protein
MQQPQKDILLSGGIVGTSLTIAFVMQLLPWVCLLCIRR